MFYIKTKSIQSDYNGTDFLSKSNHVREHILSMLHQQNFEKRILNKPSIFYALSVQIYK